MWQFWIILSGIFFVIEMATVGFLVFWFGIGALLAMIVSLFTSSIAIQTTVFVLSSTVLLFFTRPFVNKFTKKDGEKQVGFIRNCPGCGASVEKLEFGRCTYCGNLVNPIRYNWTLIKQEII